MLTFIVLHAYYVLIYISYTMKLSTSRELIPYTWPKHETIGIDPVESKEWYQVGNLANLKNKINSIKLQIENWKSILLRYQWAYIDCIERYMSTLDKFTKILSKTNPTTTHWKDKKSTWRKYEYYQTFQWYQQEKWSYRNTTPPISWKDKDARKEKINKQTYQKYRRYFEWKSIQEANHLWLEKEMWNMSAGKIFRKVSLALYPNKERKDVIAVQERFNVLREELVLLNKLTPTYKEWTKSAMIWLLSKWGIRYKDWKFILPSETSHQDKVLRLHLEAELDMLKNDPRYVFLQKYRTGEIEIWMHKMKEEIKTMEFKIQFFTSIWNRSNRLADILFPKDKT